MTSPPAQSSGHFPSSESNPEIRSIAENGVDYSAFNRSKRPGSLGRFPTKPPNLNFGSHKSDGLLNESVGIINTTQHQSLQDLGVTDALSRIQFTKSLESGKLRLGEKKKLTATADDAHQKRLVKELEMVSSSQGHRNIVAFYGVVFCEGDCWLCMELMESSLNEFYHFVYDRLQLNIPEQVVGRIAVATVDALKYLKEEHKIIHRDVKPSNILIKRSGEIKLCDFGISGVLVNSQAKTRDKGCRPYMAPERIDPDKQDCRYDVRTDVWSLGITLYELSMGRFPYPKWKSIFDQLKHVVQGPAPRLTDTKLSETFRNFIHTCLTKDEKFRPKYNKLVEHPFYLQSQQESVNIAAYFMEILDQMDMYKAAMPPPTA